MYYKYTIYKSRLNQNRIITKVLIEYGNKQFIIHIIYLFIHIICEGLNDTSGYSVN